MEERFEIKNNGKHSLRFGVSGFDRNQFGQRDSRFAIRSSLPGFRPDEPDLLLS